MRGGSIVTVLTLGLVLLAAAGCATGGAGTPISITQQDLSKLAGTWQGSGSMPQAGGQFGTLTIRPDGTYDLRAGAITAAGTIQVREGVLVTTNTSTSGLPPEKRVSQAVLTERNGQWVLTGFGHSDRGPFSYEFVRTK
jgi:hypothetical protein